MRSLWGAELCLVKAWTRHAQEAVVLQRVCSELPLPLSIPEYKGEKGRHQHVPAAGV